MIAKKGTEGRNIQDDLELQQGMRKDNTVREMREDCSPEAQEQLAGPRKKRTPRKNSKKKKKTDADLRDLYRKLSGILNLSEATIRAKRSPP